MALVLALVCCLSTMIACKTIEVYSEEETGYETKEEDGKLWAKDEWGVWREMDALDEAELDYGGKEIKVLCGNSSTKIEFQQTEETNEARPAAVYKRNKAIQNRLGVELSFATQAASASTIQTFTSTVKTAKDNGTALCDIIAVYSRIQGSLLLNGCLTDLMAIEDSHLDLSKPWWPANLVGNLRIQDSLYYVSGDISVSAIDEMHCLYFNKELVNDEFTSEAVNAGFENGTEWLYNLVYNKEWTIDKMVELSSGKWVDNGTDGATVDDKYGICSVNYCMAAVYGGCNLRMIQQDVNKTLIVSPDFTSQRTTRIVSLLGSLMFSNSYHDVARNGQSEGYQKPFVDGNSIFILQYMRLAEDNLIGNDAVEEYGMLPLPKYEASQKNYYTVLGNSFTIFSIFNGCDDRGDRAATESMLSAVLECWASEGFRKTTPVVFEMNMQLKYSPTQDETNMCEYIRAGIVFDMGRIFDTILSKGEGTINMDLEVAEAARNKTSWSAAYSKNYDRMQSNLEDFVTGLNG